MNLLSYFCSLSLLFASTLVLAICKENSTEYETKEQFEISTDIPKHLVGAKITITLADGTSSTVPSEKFKVVKRQQQFIVTNRTQKTIVTCEKEVVKNTTKNNSVSLLAGYGLAGGLETSSNPGEVEVKTKVGPSVGIQYQRHFERIILGIQGQSNGVGSGVIGYSF